MDILDDMGVSKLSAKVFFKVNHSFNMQLLLFLFKKLLYKEKKRLMRFNINV